MKTIRLFFNQSHFKNLIFLMFIFCITGNVFGQNRLSGYLKDSKGLPVINMNVRLISDAESRIEITDLDGKFTFQILFQKGTSW
jgi:iron complex outermembrane recepter protein